MLTRRRFIGQSALLTASLAAPSILTLRAARAADEWPSRNVTVAIPAAPGGTTDVIGRKLCEKLEAQFGKPFVVENKPGGAGNIAVEAVVSAPKDGYTLILGTLGNLVTNRFLFDDLKFDVDRDLTPVTRVFGIDHVLCVTNSFPAKSVAEFVEHAKANPGQVTYASSGIGGGVHLLTVMLELRTGIKLRHIPYKGSAPALVDVVAGNVDCIVDGITSSGPQIDGGNLRALAVTNSHRNERLPDIPTMEEAGVPNYAGQAWGTMMAPAGTPPEIVEKISAATQEIYRQPDMVEFFAAQGAEATSSSPADTGAFLAHEAEVWGEVIREGNVKQG